MPRAGTGLDRAPPLVGSTGAGGTQPQGASSRPLRPKSPSAATPGAKLSTQRSHPKMPPPAARGKEGGQRGSLQAEAHSYPESLAVPSGENSSSACTHRGRQQAGQRARRGKGSLVATVRGYTSPLLPRPANPGAWPRVPAGGGHAQAGALSDRGRGRRGRGRRRSAPSPPCEWQPPLRPSPRRGSQPGLPLPKIFSLKNVLELHALPWLFFSPPCSLSREPRCLGGGTS